MELLTHYQNELLGLLSIFIIALIYFLLKRTIKRKLPDENLVEEISQKSQVDSLLETKTEEESTVSTTTEENIEELFEEHLGDEEGDFGVEKEENPLKDSKEEKKPFKRRSVPAHAKTTKEDFKEFSGTRILIAEDNVINQKVIQGLLADSGIEIVIANDGVEVLETLKNDDNFVLILMDAHMPRLDGFETTKQIRNNPSYKHIPVIALSGDIASDDIQKMKDAGMIEHLEKPLKMDALYDVLYAYSSQKEANSEILDIEEGVYICGGDQNFYKEILEEFIENYKDTPQEIQKLLNTKREDDADKLLLDIIGISANLGATKLHTAANRLKSSLSNETKKQTLLTTFSQEFTLLLNEINNYLQGK